MQSTSGNSHLTKELKDAIRHMVANISKSFIVEWYTSISPTNHDFVASCESLIEEVLLKLAELCTTKLDKYKIGQLVTTLLHDHILNESSRERRQSIEEQIDNFEYDICQNLVVRLFGLLSNDSLRRVVFTLIDDTTTKLYNDLNQVPRHDFNNDRYTTKHYHEHNQYQQTKFALRAPNGNPKSFSFDDIIGSAYPSSSTSTGSPTRQPYSSSSGSGRKHSVTKTTSALYTLVIAMLTKAAFMPIVSNISEPKWLYAVIIWLCKKEERERAARDAAAKVQATAGAASSQQQTNTSETTSNHNTHQLNKQFNTNNIASGTSIIITNAKASRTLDLEEGFDIASANINFENPVCDSLKRPLDNIEIFSTEEVKSHSSCYVLYCIRYDGLCYKHASGSYNIRHDYPDVPIIDKRQTHSVRRGQSNNPNNQQRSLNNGLVATSSLSSSTSQQPDNRKSFRRSMTIKRRFREFVLLQLRLEENPKIRPYLKSIPKPTKLKAATQNIFSLPGINNIKLDQSTIKLRQRFLERFLIALNNSPFIANSYEFKEFFSYNVNPTVGMSKSKSTILQVNLNKVFVDSVRSAYSIIRSTLPGDDRQSLSTSCSKSDPDAWLTELQQSTLKLHVQTRTSHSKMNLERYIDAKMLSLNDGSPTRSSKSSSLSRNPQYQRGSGGGGAFDWMGGGVGSRGGSLRANMLAKSNSLSSNTNTNSSPLVMSPSSSTYNSNSQLKDSNSTHNNSPTSQSKSSSLESIYHDASTDPSPANGLPNSEGSKNCKSIQICDTFPIASKFIDMIHYSISRNSSCSKSPINFLARLMLGRLIERYAIQMIEATLTLENAAFSINGITSSIWDESDDPPLDLENASLNEAVEHLSKLIGRNYASHTLVPKQLLMTLIKSQLSFYLEQLNSQKRNKFVIYSFFVHLLDELEIVDN